MISIIVPIYKVEPYIRQCIESILNQTYRDFEVLLVDDGSPDKCGEICDEYARKDNRIRVFHTENKGVAAARNTGLREAKGEYIGFVDPDDWIEPNMYGVLFRLREETNADISVCETYYELVDGQKFVNVIQDAVYTDSEAICALLRLKLRNYLWNKTYKKELWAGIWFPEGHTYEDVATLYKVIMKAHVVSCTSEVLYHYRMRASSIIHKRTRDNVIDNWNAYYMRFLELSDIPQVRIDSDAVRRGEEKLARLAALTWVWASGISPRERDYDFLRTISLFVKSRIPMFGYKEWSLLSRISVFFSRYTTDISFKTLNFIYYGYCLVRRNKDTDIFD